MEINQNIHEIVIPNEPLNMSKILKALPYEQVDQNARTNIYLKNNILCPYQNVFGITFKHSNINNSKLWNLMRSASGFTGLKDHKIKYTMYSSSAHYKLYDYYCSTVIIVSVPSGKSKKSNFSNFISLFKRQYENKFQVIPIIAPFNIPPYLSKFAISRKKLQGLKFIPRYCVNATAPSKKC